MHIVDVTKVKQILKKTDDDDDVLLSQLIPVAQEIVEGYIGRSLLSDDYVDEVYETDGFSNVIYLRNYPVADGLVFTFDGSVVDESDYYIDSSTGRAVFHRLYPKYYNKLKATYTGGYESNEVPEGLIYATSMIVGDLFENSGSQPSDNVKSEKLGDYSVTYRDNPDNANLATKYAHILDRYTRIGI